MIVKTSTEDRIKILKKLVRRLREENRELKERANRDSLTGLYGRQAFYDFLIHDILAFMRKEGSRDVLPKKVVTIAYLDVDYFKQINDRYGHAAGDEVLRCVAKSLKSHTRAIDIAARFGGEEFLIAFIDASPFQILKKFAAENGEARIPPLVVPVRGVEVEVTLSGGVAPYRQLLPFSGESIDDTIRRSIELTIADADRALYCAKRSGRNRLCF